MNKINFNNVQWKNITTHFFGIIVFLILYIFTGPLIFRSPSTLFPDLGDTLIAISIMSWVSNCILDFSCNVSNYPIFHPENGTLFFTENMIGLGVVFGIILKIVNQFNYAYNLMLIFLGLANYYSMFILLRFLGIKYIGSIFSGLCFALTPYLLWYLPHIHLHALFLWPISFIVTSKLIETNDVQYIYKIAMLIALQLYFGISLGIILTLIIFIFIASSQFIKPCLTKSIIKLPLHYLIHSLGAMLLLYFFILPLASGYLHTRKNHEFTRSINDTIPFSLDFLAIPIQLISQRVFNFAANLQVPLNIQHISEAWLIGITPFAALSMYVLILKFFGRENDSIFQKYIFWPKASIIGALLVGSLMLGPVLIVAGHATNIPLPYNILYHVFPGFNAMRVPVRFIIPFSFFSAIIFGFTINAALNYFSLKGTAKDRILAVIVIMVLVSSFIRDRISFDYPKGVGIFRLQNIPKVYDHIKFQSNSPVLELPMGPPSYQTAAYFYYQLFDLNPRLGGISSYFPISFLRIRDNTLRCPDELCFKSISESTAQHFIVHLNSLDEKSKNNWLNFQSDFKDFYFIGNIDSALLWSRAKN